LEKSFGRIENIFQKGVAFCALCDYNAGENEKTG
jgi:hypothetical protein